MSYQAHEWLNLAIRWTHVFAGILWIGQTYFFTWLDRGRVVAAHFGTHDYTASCNITAEEALATGLTLEELRSRSFVKILKGRRA